MLGLNRNCDFNRFCCDRCDLNQEINKDDKMLNSSSIRVEKFEKSKKMARKEVVAKRDNKKLNKVVRGRREELELEDVY